MGTTSYLTIDGEIISETRSGVEADYVPDSLGSTIALLNSSQTTTDTWTYWPYGEVASRNGTNVTPMQFCGTLGYHADSRAASYNSARYLRKDLARWQTVDSIWPYEPPYAYALNSPVQITDASGTISCSKPKSQDPPWWCFWCPRKKRPPIPPKITNQMKECLLTCVGLGVKEMGACLAKCGVGKVKGFGLNQVFCILYPDECKQYGNTPCDNVHDTDSCQACVDQEFIICMATNSPYGWPGCQETRAAKYVYCAMKY